MCIILWSLQHKISVVWLMSGTTAAARDNHRQWKRCWMGVRQRRRWRERESGRERRFIYLTLTSFPIWIQCVGHNVWRIRHENCLLWWIMHHRGHERWTARLWRRWLRFHWYRLRFLNLSENISFHKYNKTIKIDFSKLHENIWILLQLQDLTNFHV